MDSSRYSTEIKRMHGRCGIMTACLVDPLSQLINKISNNRLDEINAVGFYYEAEIHGVKKLTVILFNIFDNEPISWLRVNYTMELFLGSPFVTKIIFYPLITEDDSSGPLLTRSSLNNKVNPTGLEEKFRALIIQIIGVNAKEIIDKNISYTHLLFKIAGITGLEIDNLSQSIITGYSLVNRVLLGLMRIEKYDPIKIASSIIPSALLKQPITYIAPLEKNMETDIKFIVEQSRREITKLAAIFIDLFTINEPFRNFVLTTRYNGSDTLSLFRKEDELIKFLIESLNQGVISNDNLNSLIKELEEERFQYNYYQKLDRSINPSTSVNVIKGNIMCTFQEPTSIKNTEPLQDLKFYLEHLIESFGQSEPLTINLGTIISLYNKIVDQTSLETINYPDLNYRENISRSGVIILPSMEKIDIPLNSEVLSIPMFHANLTLFTEDQLMQILIYINSIRADDRSNRFSNLQNEITHELAQRNKDRHEKNKK